MAVPRYILTSNVCDFQPRHVLVGTRRNLVHGYHSNGGVELFPGFTQWDVKKKVPIR